MVKRKSLETIFEGVSRKMMADFQFLSSQISHGPTTGFARELVLKELLSQYLPAKVSVGSGIVIDSEGRMSKEVDLVIYDSLNTPFILNYSDKVLIPIECVYAVIEVKSSLRKSEIMSAGENIKSIKNMKKSAYIQRAPNETLYENHGQRLNYFPVLGLVFSYTSATSLQSLCKNIRELDGKVKDTEKIDTVCVLDKGVISNDNKTSGKIDVTNSVDSDRCYIETEKTLLLFYILLMHIIPQVKMHPIKMTSYIPDTYFGEKKKQ